MVITVNKSAVDRKILRDLVSALYDIDMEKRFLAARKLGEFARTDPGLIKQVWNRIFYAFDDTMSCWGAAEGLGEIARNAPGLRSRILLLLRKFQHDEVSCQGFIWAVCRIGQVDREKIKDLIPVLINSLDSDTACMLGQTIWALGELRILETAERIAGFSDDVRETWIYENDCVRIRIIGDIARESLAKIEIRDGQE